MIVSKHLQHQSAHPTVPQAPAISHAGSDGYCGTMAGLAEYFDTAYG
jgi:hypothetical protein